MLSNLSIDRFIIGSSCYQAISNNNIKMISLFLKDIFDQKNSIEKNLQNLNKDYEKIEEIQEIIEFIKKSNKRGIATLINE